MRSLRLMAKAWFFSCSLLAICFGMCFAGWGIIEITIWMYLNHTTLFLWGMGSLVTLLSLWFRAGLKNEELFLE